MLGVVSILVKKELNSLFDSWGTYTGLLIYFMLCGIHCWMSHDNFFYVSQASMNLYFNVATWGIFILVPALSMKSISDEKKHGTLELLLSKPIVTSQLVAAKYTAQLLIGGFAILLTFSYYLTIAALGNLDHGATILGTWGLICILSVFISIGIFSSSIAKTSISAYCLTLGIEFFFFILFPYLSKIISSGFWAECFALLSIDEHLDPLASGILDSRDIIYFASITTVFLALSKYFICRSRH